MTDLREQIKRAVLDAANAWASGEGFDGLLEEDYGGVMADAALAAIEAAGILKALADARDTIAALMKAGGGFDVPATLAELDDAIALLSQAYRVPDAKPCC